MTKADPIRIRIIAARRKMRLEYVETPPPPIPKTRNITRGDLEVFSKVLMLCRTQTWKNYSSFMVKEKNGCE